MGAAPTNERSNTMTIPSTRARTVKQPSHIAYHVRDREGREAIWTRISALWPHKDGKGCQQFDVFPLDGRVSIRVYEEKRD
jgi:hypothetical protein